MERTDDLSLLALFGLVFSGLCFAFVVVGVVLEPSTFGLALTCLFVSLVATACGFAIARTWREDMGEEN